MRNLTKEERLIDRLKSIRQRSNLEDECFLGLVSQQKTIDKQNEIIKKMGSVSSKKTNESDYSYDDKDVFLYGSRLFPDDTVNLLEFMERKIKTQGGIIEKMEEALGWYGEKENWRQGIDDFGLSLMEQEDCDKCLLGGKRARQCLEEIKEMRDAQE